MTLTPIRTYPKYPNTAFPLDAQEIASFEGPFAPYHISGPPGLARLVMNGRAPTKDKDYWFDENVFTRMRERAKMDIAPRTAAGSLMTSRRILIGLYMKLCFRNDLAVCKNWTPDFDSYAILPLRPADTLVAWVGKIKA